MNRRGHAGLLTPHESVLLPETLAVLRLQPGQCVLDCTVGAGGHAAAFIEKIKPDGHLIAVDVDPDALALAQRKLMPLAGAAQVKLDLVQGNFGQIGSILPQAYCASLPPSHGQPTAAARATQIQAIFADLGVSSMQLDRPERGFSFRFDQPLDMRMDPTLPLTAADILREKGEEELADIFFKLGEERGARRIARAIVAQRKIQPLATTGQLEQLVRRALRVREHRRIHPATKTFQALRMAVNKEMESLSAFLEAAPELLSDGGTLAVISFNSLEDRQVKQRFKALAQTGRFQQIGKFVRPERSEMATNPRSRSAKLRAVRRV